MVKLGSTDQRIGEWMGGGRQIDRIDPVCSRLSRLFLLFSLLGRTKVQSAKGKVHTVGHSGWSLSAAERYADTLYTCCETRLVPLLGLLSLGFPFLPFSLGSGR